MGTGSPIDFTSADGRALVARAGQAGRSTWASRGSRPTTARATTSRTTCASPTAAAAPRLAWELRRSATGTRCSARSTRSTRGSGVLFGRSGWSGQQRLGVLWGGDQASDFWSLRVLVAATLTAAASGFSNWSHDVGGYLGERLVERCPHGAAPALAPVRLLHAADAVTRALPAGGLDLRRADARALPRVRAAARAAGAVRPGSGGDRSPLRAADHRDRCVWWIQPTAAPGGSPTPTATALRCGSRRCSRRALGSAAWSCRAATGSTSGRGSASVAAAS